MIFIRRDLSKVDVAVMDAVTAASLELSAIANPDERKEYIKSNAAVWRAFRPALRAMSHGKCWYSEAAEAVSRYDVDHFRPKGRARISKSQSSEGYSWLAFDPTNYVLAGELCNQTNREYSETSVGKGNWFPLQDPTKAATFQNKDYSSEIPILLDPTDEGVTQLIEFGEDGAVQPRSDLDNDLQEMVAWAIDLLGIRQTILNGLRAEHWRKCRLQIRQYKRIFQKPKSNRTAGELETMRELAEEFVCMASCRSVFSAMARDLLRAERLDHFIKYDEFSASHAA